ncbi:hypothetical protein PGB90_000517 [Kerria lacca]
MFVYLSKKIALPNNLKINCVQWNLENDWIAVGGEDGLLKILQLEIVDKEKNKSTGISNLSMNQTLEGHTGPVQIIAWNEQYQKLTSSDDTGLIIVWTLHRGTWYEEMINNRNKSIVKGIAWTYDGQKICIVYEDGAVIVGSVDGNRIWGKELKKLGLSCVQWSPDSKYILFGIRNGEIHLYDDDGLFSMKLKIQCLPSIQIIVHIAYVHWYNGKNGYYCDNCPVLAIAYQSGHVQLMRNQHDDDPIILDTGMHATKCQWNPDGSILAIIGSTVVLGDTKETNIIQFFSPLGEHIRTLKLPGSSVADCSWEGHSMKIAMAIDSSLYFANIHANYKWCYFSNTVVFSSKNNKQSETVVTFWDLKNNESYQKTVKSLLSVSSYKDHCVLATEIDNSITQYSLMICNSLTTVIDCKYMDLKPMWVSMNNTYVFAASQENFIMWHYLTPKSRSSMFKINGSRFKKERLYHVDDTPSGVAEVIQDLDKNFEESSIAQPTKDPICCITCSDKILLIGRRSGIIQRYTLPQVALIQRLILSSKPQCMALNCNSSKFSVIDCTGALSIIALHKDIKENFGITKEENGNDRRDVWDMKWASDNPHYLAVMEKTRMYVLKDGSPEEPITSSAYIADFENLEIKGILLDDVVKSQNELSLEYVVNYEIKSLRDTRQLLQKVGISEATSFIEKNPHPRLWRLLAEAALRKMNLSIAEMAFVRRNDYAGVQLIKKLSDLQNDQMKKALMESYFRNFDGAENLYLKLDRRDLAIALREKLGDWFKVVELMKTGSITSDSQLTKAWFNIGEFFMDRRQWEAAKEYFLKANCCEKLIICYQYLEDYEALESFMSVLPEKHPLLQKIGEIFLNVGMCFQAVDAYFKFGDIQLAIEVCTKLNQWDRALQLSNQYSVNINVNQLFDTHINQLLQKGRTLDTIKLYRKAERYLEAAELLFELTEQQKLKNAPLLLLKKMYVLVGFLMEDYMYATKNSRFKSSGINTVVSVGIDSIRNIKLLDNPWHYAEAYHILMLSQFLLINGNTESALHCSVRLRNYNDVLNPQQVYSIIAVCAISCNAFETASKAFTELETLKTDNQKDFENITMRLFSINEPKDSQNKNAKCSNCSVAMPLWNTKCDECNYQNIVCMRTGHLINSINDAWQCNICKHFTLLSEMIPQNICPLCHSLSKT